MSIRMCTTKPGSVRPNPDQAPESFAFQCRNKRGEGFTILVENRILSVGRTRRTKWGHQTPIKVQGCGTQMVCGRTAEIRAKIGMK